MTTNRSPYRPINCEFHDLLEHLAVYKPTRSMSGLIELLGHVQRIADDLSFGWYPHQACCHPTPEPGHCNNRASPADSNELGPRFQ